MAFTNPEDFAVTRMMKQMQRLQTDVMKLQTLPPASGSASAGTGASIYFNVVYYGADPSGVSECSEEIQNAIDAAGDSDGGTVYFPYGTYKIDTTLVFPTVASQFYQKRISLLGENPQTTLEWTGEAGTMIDMGYAAEQTKIENLKFKKSGEQTVTGIYAGFEAFGANPPTGAGNHRFINLWFQNITRGVDGGSVEGDKGLTGALFEGCIWTNNGGNNTGVEIYDSNSDFVRCYFATLNVAVQFTSQAYKQQRPGTAFWGCGFVDNDYDIWVQIGNEGEVDEEDYVRVNAISFTSCWFEQTTYSILAGDAGSVDGEWHQLYPINFNSCVLDGNSSATTIIQLSKMAKGHVNLKNCVFCDQATWASIVDNSDDDGTWSGENCTTYDRNTDVIGYLDDTGPFVGDVPTDLSDLTFVPSVPADWDAGDPGNADDAVDELAERVKDLEEAGGLNAMLQDIADLTDPGGDRLLFWDDSGDGGAGLITWLSFADEVIITGTTLSINHDACTNFEANEHIDWTADQGIVNIHSNNCPWAQAQHQILDNLGDLVDDPGADRYIMWDDSEGEFVWTASTGGGVTDAADLTYSPAVNTDWDSNADPGNADDALDQLAERVDDLENAGSGSGHTDEEIEDLVGAMVSGNTETGIAVTYQDGDGTLDFTVNRMLHVDDYASVQAAITAAADNGILYFPAGTWDITSTLTIPSGKSIHMIGERNGTILRWNSASNGNILSITASSGKNIIDGFTFSKNTGATVTGINAGNISQWSRNRITNCLFSSLYSGIDGGSSNYRYFDSEISNCIFYNCNAGYISSGSGVNIIGCSFNSCYYGIYMTTGNTNNKASNFVYGCVFTGNSYDIFVAASTRKNSFTNCWFEDSTYGILTSNSSGSLDQGFSFHGCLFKTNYSTGIINLNTNSTGALMINGCTIAGSYDDINYNASNIDYHQSALWNTNGTTYADSSWS